MTNNASTTTSSPLSAKIVEPTIFDLSSPGRTGVTMPASDVPETALPPKELLRSELPLPELAEVDVVRHYMHLSSFNYSVDSGFYPLGSCTMKLNATTEMIPVTWPEFGNLHPFAPLDQTEGYQELFRRLETWLNEITGFAATSFQPNAGSQGEYTGLLTIRAYQKARGQGHRDLCLIPASAHGTNPASAVMAGMDVIVVDTDEEGNIKVDDLRAKAEQYADRLAALMVTYPSTHGVFEAAIHDICEIIHARGGQVYMDGANMNAQVGLTSPAASPTASTRSA